MAQGFLVGILTALFAGLIGFYIFVTQGCMPANADATPPAIEKWMARTSLRASLRNESAAKTPDPLPMSDANLLAGIKIYAVNCAVCHGASDGAPSNIARGLYQKAPQFAEHGVTDDKEGKIHWFIKHGVRMTGMPAYTESLSDEQIWQVTQFLKRMKELPPPAQKAWKAIPSVAPKS